MQSSGNSLQVSNETGPGVNARRSDYLRPWLPLLLAATAYRPPARLR